MTHTHMPTPTPICPSCSAGVDANAQQVGTALSSFEYQSGLDVFSGSIGVKWPFRRFGWRVLDYAYIKAKMPFGVRGQAYEYRVIASQTTGIQVKRDASKACDWSASGSSWPSESLWTKADGRSVVLLVRCGLGNAATRLIVETRLKAITAMLIKTVMSKLPNIRGTLRTII